jgi:hypothetical protein
MTCTVDRAFLHEGVTAASVAIRKQDKVSPWSVRFGCFGNPCACAMRPMVFLRYPHRVPPSVPPGGHPFSRGDGSRPVPSD